MKVITNTEYNIVKNFKFRIPLDRYDITNVTPGDQIYYADTIINSDCPVRSHEIDISSLEAVDLKQTIKVFHGEVVSKGDILAKNNAGIAGLFVREVISPFDGMIDLSLLDQKKIVINSVKRNVSQLKGINGLVEKVIPDSKIVVSTDAMVVNGFLTIGSQNVVGNLEYIEIDRDKDFHKLTENLVDKVIFMDNLVDFTIINKAKALGVKAIICPGIDIDQVFTEYKTIDLNKLNSKIGITLFLLTGFGSADYYTKIGQNLKKNVGMLVSIRNKQLAVSLKQNLTSKNTIGNFTVLKKGDMVRIYESNLWGKIGKVSQSSSKDDRIEIMLDGKLKDIHINNIIKI